MYASPVGVRFLRKANKIFEDFPVSKYIFFFVIFSIEIAIVFALGIYLIR
jgi:predicted lipase